MTPPAKKPASLYLMILKIVFGLAMIALLMTGMFSAIWRGLFTSTHGLMWLLGLIGVNAVIMVAAGMLRAMEEARGRAKPKAKTPEAPAIRRFAGVGR